MCPEEVLREGGKSQGCGLSCSGTSLAPLIQRADMADTQIIGENFSNCLKQKNKKLFSQSLSELTANLLTYRIKGEQVPRKGPDCLLILFTQGNATQYSCRWWLVSAEKLLDGGSRETGFSGISFIVILTGCSE